MSYANNKIKDQTVHPRSLISVFVVRYLNSRIYILHKSTISRLYLAFEAEQSGLSVTQSQIPNDRFSRDAAQIMELDEVSGKEPHLWPY